MMAEWWQDLLAQKRHTQTSLAKLTDIDQTHLSRYFAGKRNLSQDQAKRVAAVLGVDPDFLLSRNPKTTFEKLQPVNGHKDVDRRTKARLKVVKVNGLVGAGWVETTEIFEIDEEVPYVSGAYADVDQFAYKVVGNSMNAKRIFDGDYVVCIPYWLHRTGLGTGDLVVIERHRGQLVERSVREVKVGPTHYEFWPCSTDPRWQKPTSVPRQETGTHEMAEDDDTMLDVIGLVIWRGGHVS